MAYTTINKSTDYFNTKLRSGVSSGTQANTGVGFQPDWIWDKNRASGVHAWWDAVRGNTKQLQSNSSGAETTVTQLASFDSDGFTINGGSDHGSGTNIVDWCWKAGGGQGSSNTDGSINTTYTSVNTTAGFSISTYTGNGTAGATVGHGLGVVPSMIIVKIRTGDNNNWGVYHKSMGATKAMYLDQTSAQTTDGWMNNTAPTSSVFSLSGGNYGNVNTYSYVAYCFAEKTGYSKIGSFTGNGNADGTFIYTGFKPKFILVRASNLTTNWHLYDNKRDPINPADIILRANSTNAEATNSEFAYDFVSNGFKARSSGSEFNGSGNTFIYYAVGQSLVGSNNVPCTAR